MVGRHCEENDKVKVYSRLVDTGGTSIGGAFRTGGDYAYFDEVVADARDLDSAKLDILAIYAKRARLLRHLAEQLHLLELGLACLLYVPLEQMDKQEDHGYGIMAASIFGDTSLFLTRDAY